MNDLLIPSDVLCGPATVRRSAAVGKLAAAMLAVQGEIEGPKKNKQNPHLKNWYADLGSVLDAIKPVFTRHKLVVLQLPCEIDADPALTTLLLHESGEWLETTVRLRPVKGDPQSVGSAMSYARRYALQALAGVTAEDDDDGQEASRPAPARPAKAAPPKQPAGGNGKAPAGDVRERAIAFEARLVGAGLCEPGALMAHLEAVFGPVWPAALAVVSEGKAFEKQCRLAAPATDEQVAEIGALLKAQGEKGEKWEKLAVKCGFPPGATLNELTAGQYEAAKARLAPAAKEQAEKKARAG